MTEKKNQLSYQETATSTKEKERKKTKGRNVCRPHTIHLYHQVQGKKVINSDKDSGCWAGERVVVIGNDVYDY